MPIVRVSTNSNNRRIFGFRAWHSGIQAMVDVKSCDFVDLDADAELVSLSSGTKFKAKMHELVLLQDTNMADREGSDVYEGDIVLALVGNMVGSYEEVVAEVMFDDENWGYNLKFEEFSGLPLTGEMKIIKILGNVFEGVDEKLLEALHEEKNSHA